MAAPGVGCRKQSAGAAPPAASHARQASEILPLADELVRALNNEDYGRIQAWMVPSLRAHLGLSDLEAAGRRLRETFGRPVGVLEEAMHSEGELRWYSGVWLHERAADPPVVAPVLYQIAVTPEGRLARVMVREHWFFEHIEHPAVAYIPVTRLHPPFEGEWTISHGGPTRATNHHHGSRAQRWAYDIVVKKDGSARKPGRKKSDNRSYYCYGQWLVAPAAGTVVRAVNDVPENKPGTRGRGGGNGVVIDHGFGEFSSLWHAIPGSITVRVGDRVQPGQRIGKVGNSGRSTGPHIHYHLSKGEPKVYKQGLPAPFVDVWVNGRWYDRVMPVRGDRVRAPSRKASRTAREPHTFIDA